MKWLIRKFNNYKRKRQEESNSIAATLRFLQGNSIVRYQDLEGKLWPHTNIHTNIHTDNNYPVQAKFIIKLKKTT